LSAVADAYPTLQKLGVEVIAVSTDTIFSHIQFKKDSPTVKNVPYALAADPNGGVSRAYGVYMPDKGLNQRGRFIIDPKGTIHGVEVLAGPVGRSVDELIRQVQAMQAVAANPGKAAPAGWTPGKPMITTRIPADVGRY